MKRRYILTALLVIGNIICYADRTNMGIALLDMNFSADEDGKILAAFFFGYICTQLAGGWAAVRYGGKIVLLVGVVTWTVCDVLTLASASSIALLLATRIGMGLGEGVNFPSNHMLSSKWFPRSERSRLTTLVSSGQDLGTIVALLLSPQISKYLGWQYIFVVFGALSVIWTVAFSIFGFSSPETHLNISPEEREFIVTTRGRAPIAAAPTVETPLLPVVLAEPVEQPVAFTRLLTHRGCIAIYVAHFCANYGWYVLLGWTPRFFKDQLQLDLSQNSVLLVLPYVCGFVGMLLAGACSDYFIITKHIRTVTVRRVCGAVAFFGPAVGLFLVKDMDSTQVPMAVFLLSASLFFARFSIASFWTNMLDISPVEAARIMGVSNTFASIPGIVGNTITGSFRESHGWNLVFLVAAGFYVFGGVFYIAFASDAGFDRKSASSPPANGSLQHNGRETFGTSVNHATYASVVAKRA